MYTRFFGLTQLPFSIAPDPHYLFMSERHREALAHLLYGLDGGGGFVLLTGEIGAGKTTVCRLFLEQIPPSCNVAYIFNPKQTVIELLQSICDEFGIDTARDARAGATVKDFIDPLNAFLLASHARHRNNILIIDEAQNLSADVLEQLRLLTNLETSQRKLLQIILIGQPELRTMLARPELEQLAQRIIARFHLAALSAGETAQYIAHRLAVAGMTQASPFGERAMRRIHALSRGVPRRINLLCDRALLGAYSKGRQTVDARTVTMAAHEVFDTDREQAQRWARYGRQAVIGGALAATVAVIGMQGGVMPGHRPSAAASAAHSAEKANDATMPARMPVRPAMTTEFASVPANPGKAAVSLLPSSAVPSPLPSKATPTPTPTPTPTLTSTSTSTSTSTPATISSSAMAPAPPSNSSALAWAPVSTASPLLDASVRDLSAAIRRLAVSWNVKLEGADACRSAARQALYCFASRNGLNEIRQLDRPGVLTLWDDAQGKYYAVLLGLDNKTALLQIGDRRETVTLSALAKRWHGGFTTLWRGPPDFAKPIAIGDRDDAVDWLAARLAAASGSTMPTPGGAFDAALSGRVREFQLAQGLLPDGLPGPQTLMRLTSAAGDQGPHLQSVPVQAGAPAPAAGPVALAAPASQTPSAPLSGK